MKQLFTKALSAIIFGAIALQAPAQESSSTNAGERFKWWWEREEGAGAGQQQTAPPRETAPAPAPPASPAPAPEPVPAAPPESGALLSDEYERLIRDNVELRKSIAEAEKRFRESEDRNSDLSGKMREIETREADLARTLAEVKSGGGMSVDAGRKLEEVRSEVEATRSENQVLKQRITTLTAELEKRQAQRVMAASEPALAEGSDLYRRLTEENALLRKNLMEMKEMEKKSAETQTDLARKDQEWTTKMDGMKAQVRELEDRNRELRETFQNMQTKSAGTDKLAAELLQVRSDLENRNRMLQNAEKEMEQLRRQSAARAVSPGITPAGSAPASDAEEAAWAASRDDLYFNMAVLYVQTGMYRQAEKEMTRLLKTEESSPDLHYNLGILYDTYLGDKKKARKHYRRFLELCPQGSDSEKVRLWLLDLDVGL